MPGIHPIIQEAIQEAASTPLENIDPGQTTIPDIAFDGPPKDLDGNDRSKDAERFNKVHPAPPPAFPPGVRVKGPISRPMPVKEKIMPRVEDFNSPVSLPPPAPQKPQESPLVPETSETPKPNPVLGPGQEHIDRWKAQYGQVYALALTADLSEAFIFRAIMRTEWKDLQSRIQTAAVQGIQLDMEEEVCKQFVLWPNMLAVANVKAGSYATVCGAIMEVSNFVPPQVVERLIQAL